jgi:diguanylate cyclase (GGDEF)-like protein
MRLLLLEDNIDAAASLAEALQYLDGRYEIRRVTKLKEAEEAVRDEPPEIALIDLTLPDADGCDAAIALRRAAPDLPLVALTGKNFEAIAIELVRHGVQDFLQKGTTSVQRIHQTLQLALERHRQERVLRHQACFDSLTGVMNRGELERQLEKAISHANRGVYRGAVMVIDVDDFKSINDSYGHKVGDAVLQDIAQRLMAVARAGDSIGRLGGDEFVLILEGLKSREDAAAAARKASDTTSYELTFGTRVLPISTSIGVAVFPEQGDSAQALLEFADQAMYAAKRRGKRTYCFYTPSATDGRGRADGGDRTH